MSEEKRDAATDALIGASTRHDASAIAALLADEVTYAGVWTSDPDCQELLAVTGAVNGDALGKLAACLAPLTFARSDRKHPYSNVALLTYEQGIEIEVMFDVKTSKVTWIGYAGQRTDADAVPTVTQVALEAVRQPESVTPLDAAEVKALEEWEVWRKRFPEPGAFGAWFRLCVDTSGAIASARAYSATSVVARDVFEKHVRAWRFRPFLLDGRPAPVCAMVALKHPDLAPTSGFPTPVPPEHADKLVVPNVALPDRVSGTTHVRPLDEEVATIRSLGGGRIAAFFTICLGDDGSVAWALMHRSSGYPGFDGRAMRMLQRWQFEPPTFPTCSSAIFASRVR
jgi:TonB family protein